MSNQTPFPNGTPRPEGTPDMSPAERKLWANSHNLDERYLLVTRNEMQVMGTSMAQQRTLTGALQRTFKECELILNDYWKNEPDLPNGVAAAVFDAQRYKKAVNLALPNLRKIHEAFAAAAKQAGQFNPTFANDLGAFAHNLSQQIKELDRVTSLRRDRKGGS